MNSRLDLSLVISVVVLQIVVSSRAQAAGFARSYRAPAGLPAWGSTFNISSNGPGFLLTAWGRAPTNQPGQSSRSFVRLDPEGYVDWALWSLEGLMGNTTVQAHSNQPLVFAKIEGLAEEEFWTVFGVFNARDGTRVFERGIRVIVDQTSEGYYFPDPFPCVEYLSDGKCAVVMDGDGSTVRVAVIDATGKSQWERSFASLVSHSFSIAGRGAHSKLVEDPGRGFWLVVGGSEKITTEPNPPPINYAVTLNILRLDLAGEIVWAKRISGLELAGVKPQFGPVAIGADGSLVLSFTDMVFSDTAIPAPTDFHTYLVGVQPDGRLRWAWRARRTRLTQMLALAPSTLYLAGGQFRSITPLNDDGLILKCDMTTGDSLGQVAVNLSIAEELTILGASENRAIVRALAYSPAFTGGTTFLGSFDTNLQNATWKQLTANEAARSDVVYNPESGALLFARRPVDDAQIDVVQLRPDLNPAAACTPVTNATVALLNPNLTLEKLDLGDNTLFVSVSRTSLALGSTARIQLQSITPSTEPLCETEDGPAPQLKWAYNTQTSALKLTFASQAETEYEILLSSELGQPFTPIVTIAGDGRMIERWFQVVNNRNGFYAVRARPRY